jgi:hypothetical protein
MIYEKKAKGVPGKNYSESWYTFLINSDSDGYHLVDGKKQVLFKFRKNKVNKFSDIAINTFLKESKKKHSNRGIAAGIPSGSKTARHITKTGQNEGNYIASNISGYYDRPLREHKGQLGTNVACRTTAFTFNNKNLWESALPFIVYCSKLYKQLAPKEYHLQKKEYNLIDDSLKIPKSVFTTITTNYNWRTACHKDTGDFDKGLGNLIVLGNDFTGGYLGFPEFKVLIKIEPGDFLLMDVHQFHCNTKISGNGFRLSFVMYIRQDMKQCKKQKKIGKINYLI